MMNNGRMIHSLFGKRMPQALALARLSYVNPFLPQRITLEREVLGDDYVALEREWNVDSTSFRGNNPNIAAVKAMADALVARARDTYLTGRGSEEERAAYRSLVYFAVYHRHLEEIDQMIHKAVQNPRQQTRFPAARKMLDELQACLGTLESVNGTESAAHVLALCYQLRRAFHNIFRFFVGSSEAATRLRARLWQSIFTHDLARYQRSLFGRMREVSTLVTGPSGSGKEVVARAIALSQYLPFDMATGTFPPIASQFLPVNIAALSQALIESELFGHRKGAFTGALQDRQGYFEICGAEGAVFLDEIGETPLEVQVKLLRVLQERRFQPVGDTQECVFQGKIIAATNRDLQREIETGRFRQDLYYRLCSDIVTTPPLASIIQDDPGELERLVLHVADRLVGTDEAAALTAEFMLWARENPGYDWPGNFRELEQAVKNILVHGDYQRKSQAAAADRGDATLLRGEVESAETILRRYTQEVYQRVGNYSEAARMLALDRRTVRKYVEETDG